MRYLYTKNDLYNKDIIIIKKYNDKYYKLINLNFKRNKGYEEIKKEVKLEQLEFNLEDKKKEDCNLSRARSKVFEIAMCNEFKYFCTFTLDKNKYNRHDFDFFYIKFRDFIKYMNKKYNISLKFLIVPEKHKERLVAHARPL